MRLALLALVLLGNVQGEYLPSRKGANWVYRSGSQAVIQTVAGTERVGGANCVILETNRGGKKERMWIQNSRGGLQIRKVLSRGAVNELRSPALLLKFPLKRGDSWKARIPFGNDVVEYSYRNLGPEKIRVPAGEFQAWKIQASGQVAGSRFSQVSWYSGKTGWMVKQTTDGRVMELKKYSR